MDVVKLDKFVCREWCFSVITSIILVLLMYYCCVAFPLNNEIRKYIVTAVLVPCK